LKEKAVRSYAQYRSASFPIPDNLRPGLFSSFDGDGIEDELAIFGGQTRLLARKTKTKTSSSGGIDPSPSPTTSVRGSVSPSSVASPLEPSQSATALPMNVHPSLVEYLGARGLQHDAAQLSNPPNNEGQQQLSLKVANPSQIDSINNPSSGQMGEMVSSFMGYLANRSTSNAPVSPQNSIPDSFGSVQQLPRQNWGGALEGNIQSFPKPDESFGWRGPFSPQANLSRQSQSSDLSISDSSITASNSMIFPSASNLTLQSSSPQTRYRPSSASTYSAHTGYAHYAPTPTDSGGPMVELGLLTESHMDSGWYSFMQDCGISMDSPRNSR
jgi:hypothetical protein